MLGSVTGRLSSLVRCSFSNMTSYLRHDRATSVGFPRNHALWHWCGTLDCWVQLLTNLREDWSFTITEKGEGLSKCFQQHKGCSAFII